MISEVGHYKTQWQVFFDASDNVKSDSGLSPIVTVNDVDKVAGDLPANVWVDDGATISYNYHGPIASASTTGKRYRWDSTSGLGQSLQSNTFQVANTGTVIGTYLEQYFLTVKREPS